MGRSKINLRKAIGLYSAYEDNKDKVKMVIKNKKNLKRKLILILNKI